MDDKTLHRRHRGSEPTYGDLGLAVTATERASQRETNRISRTNRIARNRAIKKDPSRG